MTNDAAMLEAFESPIPKPTRNVPLMRKVLEHIEAHPEEWDQNQWISVCGTTACFAGWTLYFTGHDLKAEEDPSGFVNMHLDGEDATDCDEAIVETASDELGLTQLEGRALFYGGNTMDDIRNYLEHFAGEKL